MHLYIRKMFSKHLCLFCYWNVCFHLHYNQMIGWLFQGLIFVLLQIWISVRHKRIFYLTMNSAIAYIYIYIYIRRRSREKNRRIRYGRRCSTSTILLLLIFFVLQCTTIFFHMSKKLWSFQVMARSITALHELPRPTTNIVPTPLRFLKIEKSWLTVGKIVYVGKGLKLMK